MKRTRRQYPKVVGEFSVQLIREDGKTVNATATDISSSVLQLTCNRPTVDQLIPNIEDMVCSQHIEVDAVCNLPMIAGDNLTMKSHGEIAYSRRITQDKYQIGIQFKEIDDENYLQLSQYIEAHL